MSDRQQRTKASTQICGYDADNISVRGQDLVGDLIGKRSFTEVLLLQALGTEPSTLQVQIVDAVLVTIMEHGMVPSAVVTRLTHYGAPESFQGAVAAGLLGVGDRYAGTAGKCGVLIESITSLPMDERRAKARDIVREHRTRKEPLPGFGHPIHRAQDPRVDRLLEVAKDAGARGESIETLALLESALEDIVGKKLVTNISAAIAAVLAEAGIPSAMMRGVVLTARCAGLVGHLLEEMRDPAAPAIWSAGQDAVDYVIPDDGE